MAVRIALVAMVRQAAVARVQRQRIKVIVLTVQEVLASLDRAIMAATALVHLMVRAVAAQVVRAQMRRRLQSVPMVASESQVILPVLMSGMRAAAVARM